MELPPKALNALVDIKRDLLNRAPDEPDSQFREKLKSSPNKAQPTMRHARSSNAFQRGCQRHAFWSPVH